MPNFSLCVNHGLMKKIYLRWGGVDVIQTTKEIYDYALKIKELLKAKEPPFNLLVTLEWR